jgi:hypothetical protein
MNPGSAILTGDRSDTAGLTLVGWPTGSDERSSAMDDTEDAERGLPLDEAGIPVELEIVEVWPVESQPAHPSVAEQAAGAIRPLLVRMDPLAQERMASWLRSLVDLRRAPLSPKEKWAAIRKELKEVTVLIPIVGAMGELVKEHVWDDRSWGFRLAGGAAAVTAATVGGKKAGLAMLGTAVAVPLWVVFGAGAAFAGLILDELEGMLAGRKVRVEPKGGEARPPDHRMGAPLLGPVEGPKGLLEAAEVPEGELTSPDFPDPPNHSEP